MIPSNVVGSFAGIPIALAKGAESDRAVRESADKAREAAAEKRAADAAGIGVTEEESAAGERDADGRQVLEIRRLRREGEQEDEAATRPAKDPTGQSGTQLDLDG
jgi:hypothetical protein